MTGYAFVNGEAITKVELNSDSSISSGDLKAATGWEVKPEGFCFGDVCIPAGDAVKEGVVDLNEFARRTGRPLVIDTTERVVSLGEAAATRGDQLHSLKAPDFTLPDLNGKLHSLSDYRGKKILLAAYASW